MREFNISQIPVVKDGEFVGSLNDADLFERIVDNPHIKLASVGEVMNAPFRVIEANEKIEQIAKLFDKKTQAVLVRLGDEKFHILTKHDLIDAIN